MKWQTLFYWTLALIAAALVVLVAFHPEPIAAAIAIL